MQVKDIQVIQLTFPDVNAGIYLNICRGGGEDLGANKPMGVQ